LRSLVASLGNSMRDVSLPQRLTTARITVALVSDEVIRAGPWSPASTGAWDPDALQDRFQQRTVVAMSWRDDDGEGPSAPVAGEVKLGGQPSTTAPKSLVGSVRDPLFSSA
jgi:hypothetical protein